MIRRQLGAEAYVASGDLARHVSAFGASVLGPGGFAGATPGAAARHGA